MLLKNSRIIYISVAALLILYLLSFTKSCKNTDSREIIKTALINQKYGNQIDEIEFYTEDSLITLVKKDNYWLVKENGREITLPADSKKIQSFITDFTKIRNLYKLSDKNDKNSAFGFQDNNTFTVKYNYPEGVHSIYFGNQDFAQTSRYLMTDKNTQVYEIDNTLDKYLSANSLSWTEPFLISQEILGKIKSEDIQSAKVFFENKISAIDDLEKLLDLRHGGFPDFSIALPENQELNISMELGNKSTINLTFYSTNLDSQYLVQTEYINSNNSKYSCWCKISSWTYNKIKEIIL